MACIGEDRTYTAMSNAVGLPVAICAKMILTGQLQNRGVVIPINPEIYNSVLDELEEYGIHFVEKEIHPPRFCENDLRPWN